MAPWLPISKHIVLASIFFAAGVEADPLIELNERIEALEAAQESHGNLTRTMQMAERVIQFETSVLTVLGILIAFATVGAPVVIYVLQNRSRKEIQDLLGTQRQQFNDYLKIYHEELRKTAIRNLRSAETHIRAQALAYLSLNQYQTFSEEELGLLFLAVPQLEEPQRAIPLVILTARENDWATRYFNGAKIRGNNLYFALRYASNSRTSPIYQSITNYICTDPFASLERFLRTLDLAQTISKDLWLRFLNDGPLLDMLGPATVFNAGLSLQKRLRKNTKLTNAALTSECGARCVQFATGKQVTFWAVHGPKRHEVAGPSVAGFNMFREYVDGKPKIEVVQDGTNKHLFDEYMEKYR